MSMSFEIENYRNIPFSTEINHADFYTYANVKDLAVECETYKDVIKRRTVGILHSQHGKFFLTDMGSSGIPSEFKIQVSLAYLKSPPPSVVIPYPVQVLGTLQWRNRPVIFAKILQVLNIQMAIRIRDILSNIAAVYTVRSYKDLPPEEPN